MRMARRTRSSMTLRQPAPSRPVLEKAGGPVAVSSAAYAARKVVSSLAYEYRTRTKIEECLGWAVQYRWVDQHRPLFTHPLSPLCPDRLAGKGRQRKARLRIVTTFVPVALRSVQTRISAQLVRSFRRCHRWEAEGLSGRSTAHWAATQRTPKEHGRVRWAESRTNRQWL